MDSFEKLKTIVNGQIEIDGEVFDLAKDVAKVDKNGNKAAGIRIRKVMQKVKETAQEIREEIAKNRKKT